MKNFIMTGIFFIITVLFPFELFAAGASVGANVWYAWFEPGFKDNLMGKNDSTSRNNNFEMTEPASLVYGGLFALQFTERLSLGGVLSYGTGWKCKADYIFDKPAAVGIHMYKEVEKLERFEGDLTLNYGINSIFKVFFGWKYFGEKGSGSYYYTHIMPAANGQGEFDVTFDSNGPGAGLGSIFNIVENLYLITTLSGIYQKSKNVTTVTGSSNSKAEISEVHIGGNGSMNLAYVIPETSVTLSLGGRYQYLKNMDTDTRILFYGAVLSAIYAFNI